VTDKKCDSLQNCTNSEKVLVGPYGETYPASHDANQTVSIKAEEVSDAEEEVDPLRIAVQEVKAEPEVSCMSAVRQISQICRNASCLSHLCLSVCLCVHMKQLHGATDWPLKTFF
jgi:hypothetical protein